MSFHANRHGRVRFFRRVAAFAFAAMMLVIAAMFAGGWLLARGSGAGQWMGPVAILLFLFAVIAVVTVSFGATRRFASSLNAVMDAADRVAGGDYSARVQPSGPPPVRALAHSFNTMTERLQHADRLRRDLMADLAHELRTPLSVLQGRIEGVLDGVYERDDTQLNELLEETRVLSRLIGDLRVLALSDAGALPLEKEAVDVGELVRDTTEMMDVEARKKPVTLCVAPSGEHIVAELDPVRVREVLTNLLTNAIRHTPVGGSVATAVERAGDTVRVTVSDTGEGIPADDAPRIFDRFFKAAASRGSGLGLPIAKAIVTAHGGEIVVSSQLGCGTSICFTLPLIS